MQQQKAFLIRSGAVRAALRLDHVTRFEAELADRHEPLFRRLNEISATMIRSPERQGANQPANGKKQAERKS
jgi:hypothetical protein